MKAKDFLSDAVKINPHSSVIDALRTQLSNEIVAIYQRVFTDSNGMKLSARQIYSTDEIADTVYQINILRSKVLSDLPSHSQARRALNELIRFIK
jgi:hypothetical protein